MSEKIPNQKYIYLNQTKPEKESFIMVKSVFAINAASRLNKTGLRLYIYFLSQVPHTFNRTEKNEKRGNTPFHFYSSTAAKRLNLSQKGVQDGINELISYGYLIELKKDCFQFNDYIQEDLDIMPEEREKIISLEEAIKSNQSQRENELMRIASSSLKNDSFDEQPRRHYDWE